MRFSTLSILISSVVVLTNYSAFAHNGQHHHHHHNKTGVAHHNHGHKTCKNHHGSPSQGGHQSHGGHHSHPGTPAHHSHPGTPAHHSHQGNPAQHSPQDTPADGDHGGSPGYDSHGSPGSVGAEQQACLDEHNKARREVQTKPLAWSSTLEDHARAYGKVLAQNGCNLEHSHEDGEGENLFSGSGSDFGLVDAVKAFDDEKSETGPGVLNHYTQVVWKDTTDVGCAKVPGDGGCIVVVCRYSPAGNVVGESPY